MKTTIHFTGGESLTVEGSLEETYKTIGLVGDPWVKLPGPKGDVYIRRDAISQIGPEREKYASAQFT